MNEDDTFKVLSRPNYSELVVLVHSRTINSWSGWVDVMNENKWTLSEYLTAYVQHMPSEFRPESLEKYISEVKSILDKNHVRYE